MKQEVKIGDFGTHTDIYEGKEPMTVIGIRENQLELEGDYSGGTHNIRQSEWMSIEGFKLDE